MSEVLNQAVGDYLRTIYELTQVKKQRVTTTWLAQRLDLTPGSVTSMFQKMAQMEPPLLEYHKYQGVVLTAAGKEAAVKLVRLHRLLELFLHEMLEYSWDEVHDIADRLEHVVSPDFGDRLAKFLDYPDSDPYGCPIPSADLEVPAMSVLPLSELQAGQHARVQWVRDNDPELLRYLGQLGVRPGASLKILERSPFDDNLHLLIEGEKKPRFLWPPITDQVFVELLH